MPWDIDISPPYDEIRSSGFARWIGGSRRFFLTRMGRGGTVDRDLWTVRTLLV
ncbi:MAG: hypothetical protein M0Z94_09445 [Dehalococcoidales bacterium]|nr:hypothetical protein [Dehalococcoidales bacterium]